MNLMPEILSREDSFALLEDLLRKSDSEQTELVLEHEALGLTRFDNNTIRQNISRDDAVLYVRSVNSKRIGVCSVKAFSGDGPERALRIAKELSDRQPPIEDFVSLPRMKQARELKTYYETTAGVSPMERAEGVAKAAANPSLKASGVFETSCRTLCVANSLGVRQYCKSTGASFSATIFAEEDSSGWAEASSRNVRDIDIQGVTETASRKALDSRNPVELEPGEYTVILEEAAVATLLLFLSFLGFGAKGFLQGRSFMSKAIGKKITGENITIVDDPFHPLSDGIPFDYEGVPKKRVVLIDGGVAKGVVYDSLYGARAGKESTGHALRPGNSYGPYPRNLLLKPGKKSKADLIGEVTKGILVTRFWYTNFKNPRNTEVTGLTRDGTFLIEKGRITKALKPARYSESILGALSRCELSDALMLRHQYGSSMVVPAARIEGFHFD